MLLPFLLLLVALSIDIGNWWVHKRHLQLQADAAALAGGGRFNECFANPAGADAVITGEATKYAGVLRLDVQRAGRQRQHGRDHRPLPEQDVRGRRPRP